MVDTTSQPLVLYGCRQVIAASQGAFRIERQVEALEEAAIKTPDLAVDIAKTLIETVCKTILLDRGQEVPQHSDIGPLVRDTCRIMQLLPSHFHGQNNFREATQRIIGGLQNAVEGLGFLRNQAGLVSHGRDAYLPTFDPLQGVLAARMADAIVHFLYYAHRTYAVDPTVGRVRYEDNDSFNQYLDIDHGPVILFEAHLEASQLLFNHDEADYRVRLKAFLQNPIDAEVLRQQRADFEAWLDQENEVIEVMGNLFKPSEVLARVDDQAYRDALLVYLQEAEDAQPDQ